MNAPSKITLYIAGPMTGLPQLNYPAFHEAAKQLRDAGYVVLNPAETDAPCRNPSWEDWMRAAIKLLIQADHVATLHGFEKSKGALLEVKIAHALGMAWDPVSTHLRTATKLATATIESVREREPHPVHIPEHLRDTVTVLEPRPTGFPPRPLLKRGTVG